MNFLREGISNRGAHVHDSLTHSIDADAVPGFVRSSDFLRDLKSMAVFPANDTSLSSLALGRSRKFTRSVPYTFC